MPGEPSHLDRVLAAMDGLLLECDLLAEETGFPRELLAEVCRAPRVAVATGGEPDLLIKDPIGLLAAIGAAARAGEPW